MTAAAGTGRTGGVGHLHGRTLGWWGVVTMIATEGMLFALLLFVYLQLRANADRWPLGDIAGPELVESGLRTVVLFMSSVPIHLADRAAHAGDQRELRWSLALTWVMGALFLAGHVDEWAKLLAEFTPATNAYGSAFYTITGFHALHVAVGLVVVAYLWAGAVTGRYGPGHATGVTTGAMYWHFVDAVWIVVYGTLYVSVGWP